MGNIHARWPDGLYEEIEKFASLIASEDAVEEVTPRIYLNSAKASRDDEESSIHILYATEDSIEQYYSKSTNDWVNSETVPQTVSNRRRLIIIEHEAFGSLDFQKDIAKIYEKFNSTSDLKVLFDSDVIEFSPGLLRDVGIFREKSSKLKGFFTFLQLGTKKVLSQSPGIFYIVKDQEFLQDIINEFDQLWENEKLVLRFEDRLKMIDSYIDKIPKSYLITHKLPQLYWKTVL